MSAQRIRWRFPGGWKRSAAAILIGNLFYYAIVDAQMPPASQQPLGVDWSLGVDFLICVVVYRLTARFW